MSTKRVEIGYVCSRGHYCFGADPEEDGSCGSKSVARIVIEIEPGVSFYPPTQGGCGYSEVDYMDNIMEADRHLGEQIATWRGYESD